MNLDNGGMILEYKPHPLADIFPLMTGEEFVALKADIKENGLLEPIWVLDGLLLDGRNRFRACQEVGVNPVFRDYEGDNPTAFVISLNLKRRHLDESQRAMVAAKLANMKVGENQHRGCANLHTQTANLWNAEQERQAAKVTRLAASEMLNVGIRSVSSAKKVIEKGSNELIQAVEAGEIPVSTAEVIAEVPKEEQSEIIAKGEKEIIREANRIKREKKQAVKEKKQAHVASLAANIPDASERYTLVVGDCLSATEVGTVDWIITDPPYPKEYLNVYDDLAVLADKTLRPGGLLIAMVGQSYLPDIIKKLSCSGLSYHWSLAYLTPGGQAVQVFPRKVNTFWKPVLVFSKGEYQGDWFGDVTSSSVNDNDKNHHHWGQSCSGMLDLIKRFVKPGDTVLDPFLGGGTTILTGLELGCNVIGYDIDEAAITTTKARIGEMNGRLSA